MRLSGSRRGPATSRGRRAFPRCPLTIVPIVLAGALALAGCGDGGEVATDADAADAPATLSGTVTYRERMALPVNATITVRLQDISRQDVPALLLGETSLSAQGKSVPIPWTLEYDPDQVQERFSYAVRGEIRDAAGRLLWTTDTVHPVLTRGAPTDGVDILLRRVSD